ncbi:DUF5694 domain-containing protein [Neolewinella persica]|uniref:DUF5694 domain-containing protein n=1 Tax=Neolewinella persica TaxID=70998 RepID=UPI00039EC250|nr:DUF5694 domain-containing protein [Neolewinella persica]
MPRFLILLCCLGGLSLSAQRPQVSVLGLLHLHNPGRDAVNADVGDIRSPQRQAELREVVDLVGRFKPTKIAFEFAKGDTLWSDYYYQAWLENRLEEVIDPEDEYLLTSEIVQLAYPLARAAGLDHLDPIDAFTSFPLDSALAHAETHGQTDEVAAFQKYLGGMQVALDSLVQLTVPDLLRAVNSRFFGASMNQAFYLRHLVDLGQRDDYPGTYVVEEWYARNLRIFTNLHRIMEPEDRILVLFGAGHKEILDDLIRDRVDWDWVDSSGLLSK